MLKRSQVNLIDGLFRASDNDQQQLQYHGDILKDPNFDNVLNFMRFALCDQTKLLDSAVDLLDNIKGNDTVIQCYHSNPVSNSTIKRKCWRIPGSDKGTEYTCLLNYCPCANFTEMTKCASEGRVVMCKHLVAIRIATAMNLVSNETLNDDQFVGKMCEPSMTASSSTNRQIRW